MTTIGDIIDYLKTAKDTTVSGTRITGVAPLSRAGPHDMTFRNQANKDTKTDAGLVLTRGEFSRAAWKFFPPGPAKIDWGTPWGRRPSSIHETALIGKDAFAYEWSFSYPCEPIRVPQYGGVALGESVAIGAYTCVDRGMFDDTTIGDYTKVDNLVHVGHNVSIGRRNLIIAGVVFGGSSVVGDDCFIGMNSTIRDHIKIGNHVTIGMGAVVTKDVPSGEVWAGNPARKLEKP